MVSADGLPIGLKGRGQIGGGEDINRDGRDGTSSCVIEGDGVRTGGTKSFVGVGNTKIGITLASRVGPASSTSSLSGDGINLQRKGSSSSKKNVNDFFYCY